MVFKQSFAFILTAVLTGQGHAYQPWEEQQRRQTTPQNLEQLDRPVTNTLKGAEIKEFRDKLNWVKAQIFKGGNVPAGAAFRSEVKDASTSETVVLAEARFDQFSVDIQSQIVAQLPEATQSNQRILIEVPWEQSATSDKPAFAKFTDSKTILMKGPDPLQVQANILPQPQVPSLTRVAGKVELFKPFIADVARTVAGRQGGQVRVESRVESVTSKIQPVAVLPLEGGGELLVESVTQTLSADIQLTVRADTSKLPEQLKAQIVVDQPSFAKATEGKPSQEIIMVIALKPDNSIRVESIKPLTSDMPSPIAQQSHESNEIATAPTGPRDDKPGFRSQEPRVLLVRARELGQALGIKSETVTIENRELKTEAVSQTVPVAVYTLEQGGTVVIQETGGSKAEAPHYSVEAKFRDLSPALKAQVQEKLSEFGGAKALTEDSNVAVELHAAEEKKFEVTAVTLINPNAPENQKDVVLWKQETVMVEEKANPSPPTTTQPPLVVERAVSRGLGPAVACLAKEAFGMDKGTFEIRDPDSQGKLRVQTVKDQKRVFPMSFKRPVRGRPYEFSLLGRPLEFSDAIRDQIYTQLKEAVENGDTWATEALNGLKDMVVEFEVVEEGAKDGQSVRVKTVSPAIKDLAAQAALDMGLASGDYLIVNIGGQTLLVMEKGATAVIKTGKYALKITSPDGDAKILLKANLPAGARRAKQDQAIVLLLSKKSLKANRDAITKEFGGAAARAVDETLKKNPEEDQFFIRLDPATEQPILIQPASSLQSQK